MLNGERPFGQFVPSGVAITTKPQLAEVNMALKYPAEWRFNDGGGQMPKPVVDELVTIVERVSSQANDPQVIFEIFKSRFGNQNRSSSSSWAHSDMTDAMHNAKRSIPEFIEAYWTAMEEVGNELTTPSSEQINQILNKHGVGYVIKPPNLLESSIRTIMASPAAGNHLSFGYELVEEIGHGGFGEVHKAIRASPVGNFEFAIKLHQPSAFTDEDRAKKRFKREVNALQKMQHRAIVPYIDAGLDPQGRPFLVMQLITGQNIRDATSPNDPRTAVEYVIELLRAVEYAHSLGVIHRDLKPSNILIRQTDSQVIVVDFGLAYVFEEATQHSLTTNGIGTPAYTPPEVWLNPKARNPHHDIFSCGVILYELFARRIPIRDNYIALSQLLDPALAKVDEVIKKALAPSPYHYQSATDFRRDLSRALSSLPLSPF